MKVYIDFDRTLFDCDQFLGELYEIIQRYDIPKRVFKDCQIQCKKEGFNPYLILKKVEDKSSFNRDIYQDIDKLLENTSNYLYDDTRFFLEYLKKHNYEVIILTKGNHEFQQKKILNANIQDYYSDLVITMKHKGSLEVDYKSSTFIDDNPIEIKSILRRKPQELIRIKRSGSKYDDVVLENVLTVNSLQEIVNRKLL